MTLSLSPLSLAEVARRRATRSAAPTVELHDERWAEPVVELRDESETS